MYLSDRNAEFLFCCPCNPGMQLAVDTDCPVLTLQWHKRWTPGLSPGHWQRRSCRACPCTQTGICIFHSPRHHETLSPWQFEFVPLVKMYNYRGSLEDKAVKDSTHLPVFEMIKATNNRRLSFMIWYLLVLTMRSCPSHSKLRYIFNWK